MKASAHLLRGVIPVCLILAAGSAVADEHAEEVIAQASRAAPPAITDHATIVDRDHKVVRAGSNGWTCMPNTMPGDNAPMCNDAVWMKLLKAVGSKSDFETDRIGLSYMLAGDYGAGVSNSDPYHPNPGDAEDYVETGPHLMIVVPKAMLEGITTDFTQGGPYVMWKDTPYAHIMVPVGE